MKITVEVEDFYLEEQDLSEALKKYVTDDVVRQISASIKTQTEALINSTVKQAVLDTVQPSINEQVSKLLVTGEIKKSGYGNEKTTVEAFVKEAFEKGEALNSVKSHIEKLSKTFADDMKKRYDAAFASQVVMKLNEQGFLKEDVVKALLK